MKRRLYVSRLKSEWEEGWNNLLSQYAATFRVALRLQDVEECSVFRDGLILFIYTEASHVTWSLEWPEELTAVLDRWNDLDHSGYLLELVDVFHDSDPSDEQSWRSSPPEKRKAAMAKIKAEKYSSYVYYHYQMQEERPGSFNRTYVIGSYGLHLFSYCELPAIKGSRTVGQLMTKQTPEDWHDVMMPHFERWDDKAEGHLWKEMGLEFTYSSTGEEGMCSR